MTREDFANEWRERGFWQGSKRQASTAGRLAPNAGRELLIEVLELRGIHAGCAVSQVERWLPDSKPAPRFDSVHGAET